jgi:hypothetical protein
VAWSSPTRLYGTPKPLTSVYISAGVSAPSGRGLFGGYPSAINANVVLRKTDLLEQFKQGKLPTDLITMKAASREILPAKTVVQWKAAMSPYPWSPAAEVTAIPSRETRRWCSAMSPTPGQP